MNELPFMLNGERVVVRGADPHTTLLQWLRESGRTGSKEGCAEGECGACAVVLREADSAGQTQYTVVNSCLVTLPMVADREVYTVEGVAGGGELHPVQAALAAAGGSQCGYCTPGFVMSLFAEYYRAGRGEGFDPEALSGNLCRCTGYRPIREAAAALGAPAPADPFARQLSVPAPEMQPVEYEGEGGRFYRPRQLAEVFDLLARYPDGALVAGGTDLVVEATQRYRRWPTLISLEAVPELKRVAWTGEYVELGAGLTLTEVERQVAGRLPMLAELLPLFASRLIRNRATLGGNLATASPIGDSAPALLALDAQVRIAGRQGERQVALADFFTGYRQTALQPGEVLVSVRIPTPLPQHGRFYKVAKRRRDDISTVAAGMALELDSAGRVRAIRLAFGGVAATPVRAVRAEAALLGQPWNERTVQVAQAVLREEFQPLSDHRGSAAYRRALVQRLLAKFYAETRGVTV